MLAAGLTLAGLPATAEGSPGRGEAWDDSHMQSRHGGPRTGPLQAGRIEGQNRFDPAATAAPVSVGVAEQFLPASQHAWSRRTTGFGNVPSRDIDARRPEAQTESRHNRNPASWSRTTQSSSLRANAVRRSAGGR